MSTRLADHCGRELARIADREPSIWVLDGDLADSDGAWHFAERHPGRFLMAGIAEQNMVSVAAGMASAGLRPWVFSFAAFLCYRACDQVRVCLSQARQPVVLVGSHSGGTSGRNGKSHSALNDLAIMLSLPRIQVWSPGDLGDVDLAVRTLTERPAGAYLRMPRRSFAAEAALPGRPAPTRWLRPRARVSIVATGVASHWALGAAARLADAGHDVGILHVLRLAPMPSLAEELREVEQIAVIEDHHCHGGLASLVARSVPSAAVACFGWPGDWSGKSGDDDELRAAGGLSDEQIADRLRELIAQPASGGPRR